MKKNIILNLDEKTTNLVFKLEKISCLISMIGILIIYIHFKFYISKTFFEIGINIFQGGLSAGIFSYCFGIFFNGIKKGLLK